MKPIFLTPLFILIFLLTSCNSGPNSGRGFALPKGDTDKGRTTFVDLECNSCHSIGDIERIPGHEGPDIYVRLGGEVSTVKTYGDLMTSVINPSYKTDRRYANTNVAAGEGNVKMIAHNDTMTVQQLVDLVTYLETNYEYIPPARSEYARYRVNDD